MFDWPESHGALAQFLTRKEANLQNGLVFFILQKDEAIRKVCFVP
jgi:hypothetical protein